MIEIKNITKSFKTKTVLNNISLSINEGELFVLIGASGCGKTTLLKMINKLISPTSGDIIIKGKSIYNQDTIKLRRNIGYVIQQTGLFPHMTVRENIELVSRLEGHTPESLLPKTNELLNMVDLDPDDFIDRYPAELSGGQQQRIGVARAFATDAEVILMDEPFSALDPITRSELQDQLFAIQQDLHKTIIFVTHDMDEAIKLASRICILNSGEILQIDTPYEILKNPANSYVEEFVGSNKFWTAPEFIKAKDIMITKPIKANLNHSVLQAIKIMGEKGVDGLVVTDRENNYKGIVRLIRLQAMKDKDVAIRDILIKDAPVSNPDDCFIDILTTFNTQSISYIPVVDKDKLIGLITKSSLLSVLSNQLIEEVE
ncbi:MAG: ABC transporter ATP-binding protein [Clostridium sp.]